MKPDHARKSKLETKLARGERWTDAERVEWWVLHGGEICEQTDRLVMGKKVRSAITLVIKELAAVAISQTLQREKLEDRVSALEASTIKIETTTVTKFDERGRILEFVKRAELMEKPPEKRKAIP